MKKHSNFKSFLFFLFVCKFVHFNAPFFADIYKKYYVMQRVSGEILGFSMLNTTNDGGGEILSLYDLLAIVFPRDVILLKNGTRAQFVFSHDTNFYSTRTFLRISYTLDGVRHEEDKGFYQSSKLKEFERILNENSGKPIATEFFIYAEPHGTKFLSLNDYPAASGSQILSFFSSAALLFLSYVLLFCNASHPKLIRGLCILSAFTICWTYGVKFLIYFLGFIFIWLYYKLVVLVYTQYKADPKIEGEP